MPYYEPTTISLCTPAPLIITPPKMEPLTPPNPMPEHQLGYEILTKHKEAIRQLRWLAHWGPSQITKVYRTGRSIINRILKYGAPERARPIRTGAYHLLNQ